VGSVGISSDYWKVIDGSLHPFKVQFIYLAARRGVRAFPFDLAPTALHNVSLNVLHLLRFAFVIRQRLDQNPVSQCQASICGDGPKKLATQFWPWGNARNWQRFPRQTDSN